MKTSSARLWAGWVLGVICTMHLACVACAAEPITVDRGVHLLIDDCFIESSTGVVRRVNPPQRTLEEPVVTGRIEHQNWQPFCTVLHDPTHSPERPFRMWYNVDTVDDPGDGEFFGVMGHLDSTDGITWPGPYTRLDSLPPDGRVRFGASVLDEGADFENPLERYRIVYFDAGPGGAGMRVADSSDGILWNPRDAGAPQIDLGNGNDIWSAGYDPLRERYFLFHKVMADHTWTNADGETVTANIRRYAVRYSEDFRTWTEPEMIFSPDERDDGITQWYGPAGFLVRGDLIIGFLRVLRDDPTCEGAPVEAVEANVTGHAGVGAAGTGGKGAGLGYTVLTWTRDGQTWHRDTGGDRFFEPNPLPGAWDHAMSWVGSAVEVNDEVYLYYAGYRWGHKYHHSVDRQLGLVRMQRDRFVAREANGEGSIVTPVMLLDNGTLALNVECATGEVRVQVTDEVGTPIDGFRFEDCQPITTDSLSAHVAWRGELSTLSGRPLKLEFELQDARLFGFELK